MEITKPCGCKTVIGEFITKNSFGRYCLSEKITLCQYHKDLEKRNKTEKQKIIIENLKENGDGMVCEVCGIEFGYVVGDDLNGLKGICPKCKNK